ncbi:MULTISPECIES: EpsG family protein [Vibrio]|uniref:EpsG family protein n=1 Tax=Vibrio TaxID=662 RepID=UPI0014825D85|nr:EpsG family protein [Vibrio sp. F12]
MYFLLAYSIACFGYFYERTNDTGDLSRYLLSYDNYVAAFENRTFLVENIYEAFYPVWYSLFYFLAYFDLEIQHLTFISGFVIYFSMFYVVHLLSNNYEINSIKIEGRLILKIVLFFSIFVIFSSYRNLMAFSLAFLGTFLVLAENKRLTGWGLIIISLGIHPISWFAVVSLLVSKFKICTKRIFFLFLMFGLLFPFVSKFSVVLLSVPFLGEKINTYILGQWGTYRFHENGEFIRFTLLLAVWAFIFFYMSFIYRPIKKGVSTYLCNYNNFLAWFLSFAVIFITLRTFSMRLFLDGFVFVIPFAFNFLYNRFTYKKDAIIYILVIIWFFMVDLRGFNYGNEGYQVGAGFPENLLSSFFISV